VVATAGEDQYDAKKVLFQISGWKNRMMDPAAAVAEIRDGRQRGSRADDYAVLAAAVYPRYEQSLRAAGACDFDDLLLRPVELLRERVEVREAIWRRWEYLMVDEYQDTNLAQLELARLVAGPRKNLCVVGDDDQSIYGWRGADARNILDFERHYPGARTVVLEENYRSTQRILDAANAVIACNVARKPKRMRTGNGPGPRIDYWELDEQNGRGAEEVEAALVAREVAIRRFREHLPWGEFAVLYRANHQSRLLEEALRAANIPYRVVGGTSFFDRKEVADAAAYLRLALNPQDEVSLRRVINYPTRAIGRVTLLRLVETARETGSSLWEVVRSAGGSFPAAQAEALRRFVALVQNARADLLEVEEAIGRGEAAEGSLQRWAEELVRGIGLEQAIRQENKNERAAEIRTDVLRDFLASIGAYERRRWAEQGLPDEEDDWTPPTLAGFLEQVSLVNDTEEEREEEDDGRKVTLMTLHSAKGLEFAHVFLVGLEEEILPHARTVAEVAAGAAGDPIAEERRLFYVGITRARHRLTLSGCRTRRRGGEALPRLPSRFLREIPAELLEVHSASSQSSLTQDDRTELRESFFAKMRDMLAG
jgi:DNA helicase II / ATP-dependent DNA helicase PcrA